MTIPPHTCWDCGYQSGAADCLEDDQARPEAGSLSLCFNCGALGVFKADFTRRPLTTDEHADLPAETLQSVARTESARCHMFSGVVGPLIKRAVKEGRTK